MSTYAYNSINGQGQPHPHYKKIEYHKTREEEEKDHASYAAIIEYSQMQEKLLVNLRHQLEKIRGVDNREVQQMITPSFTNHTPSFAINHTPSHSVSPSVTAFKNAAIAARKLPSHNSRNKHKQISPTILNPKRDYPRPWAMDKMIEQTSENASEHTNFATFDNGPPFRPQYKNPQKQYYSSAMERHQPIPINCAFHEGFNIQPLCRNCQIPINNDAIPRDGYYFPNQGNYEQYGNTQQMVPKMKGGMIPSPSPNGQISNSRPWNNNYYVTEEILNDNASQFNSVVFPDPQAKKHPYLAKILEKTISNTYNDSNTKPASNASSRIHKQLKSISGNQNTSGPVKVYNLMEMKEAEREIYPSWGSRVQNNHPSLSLNVHVEESVHEGQKTQVVTKISSSISIGMGERQDEMTLLPPRCILSSLSPIWSQTTVPNNRDQQQQKGARRGSNKGPLHTDSESDDGKRNKSYATVKGKLEKEKSESVGAGRAVTYQVFTHSNNKVLSEWGGPEPDSETKADGPGKNIEAPSLAKDDFRHSRNAQSSGDESYGSMKVIRDSNEDFVKRIYDDFESFEDFDAAVEKEIAAAAVDERKKSRGHREGDTSNKPTVIKVEPQPPVVKAKDSRSLVRNQRLPFYKKKDGAASGSSSRKESTLRLPIVNKSISWTNHTNVQSSHQPPPQNLWPPLVIEKMFPEVDKALEEARGLSPFVDNLDKMFERPPDLQKMIDDKVPWTWRSSPLEEFITDSVGVFRGSKSSLCGMNDSRMSTSVARKTTSQLNAEVKNAEIGENGESDTEPIRPIASAQVAVAPTKQFRTLTGEFPQTEPQATATGTYNDALLNKATNLAGKAATALGTYRDFNANVESKMDTLNKVIELGQVFAKTKKNNKSGGLRAKSMARIVLPNPKLKETLEETTILEKNGPEYTKLDRRQLKRLMDNPGSYTHFDGTINTERLLKEGNLGKLNSLEKRLKDKKRGLQSATVKTGTSSKPRKKTGSKTQPHLLKNKI